MKLAVLIPVFFTVLELGARVTKLYKGTIYTTVGSFTVFITLLTGCGIQRLSSAL